MTLSTKRAIALYVFLISSAAFGIVDLLLYSNQSWNSTSWVLNTILGISAVVAWCRYDSQIRNFPLSGSLVFIIWALAIVGVPMYLIRSRGWARATRIGFGFPIFILSLGLYYSCWYGTRWVAAKTGYFG